MKELQTACGHRRLSFIGTQSATFNESCSCFWAFICPVAPETSAEGPSRKTLAIKALLLVTNAVKLHVFLETKKRGNKTALRRCDLKPGPPRGGLRSD